GAVAGNAAAPSSGTHATINGISFDSSPTGAFTLNGDPLLPAEEVTLNGITFSVGTDGALNLDSHGAPLTIVGDLPLLGLLDPGGASLSITSLNGPVLTPTAPIELHAAEAVTLDAFGSGSTGLLTVGSSVSAGSATLSIGTVTGAHTTMTVGSLSTDVAF